MSLKEIQRFQIPVKDGYTVRSLVWQGDELVDWIGGEQYGLDGSVQDMERGWRRYFNAAVASADGKYAVVYGRLGTKGLILKEGKRLREINRSYYHADRYEYPIALFELPDGRTVIAHCPDEYNKIEIEEVESGKRLTTRTNELQDFFHSSLQASRDGKYLLSAGWVWQGINVVQIFNIEEALRSPQVLDTCILVEKPDDFDEEISAVFQENNRILLAGNLVNDSYKNYLLEYSVNDNSVGFNCVLEETPGAMMPVGKDYVVGFYGHPKLFEIATGKVVHRWPDLKSGNQYSCFLSADSKLPPLALDPERKRFAVADEKLITVIQLG